VQLASVGLQDEYLTGKPDVTYFIKKFNRHTKFTLETLDVPFNQTKVEFGSWVNVIVPRNGQLVRALYLKLVLPPLSTGGYTNSIGTAIVEYADLLIGGQLIERINGEYMNIYNNAFISDSQQDALTYMVGDAPNGLGSAISYSPSVQQPLYGFYPRTFIVPLPFYFMRNEALSIPLCALTRSEIEVQIQLRPLSQLIAGGNVPTEVVSTTSLNWSIPPNYVENPSSPYFTTALNNTIDKLSNVVWLPYSYLFACTPVNNTKLVSNIYYYNYNLQNFSNFTNYFNFSIAGSVTAISQNNSGVTIIGCGTIGANTAAGNSTGYYRSMISLIGLSGQFATLNDAMTFDPVDYISITNDGTNFVAIGKYSSSGNARYTVNSFSSPNYETVSSGISTTAPLVSVSWSTGFQAFVIGDSTGVMYTYKIGQTALNKLLAVTGPYSTYSNEYGQIYSKSPVVASDSFISNTYASSFDGGQTWSFTVPYIVVGTLPTVYTTSIAYSPYFNQVFALMIPFPDGIEAADASYSIGIPQTSNTFTYPVETGQFRATLPVEYVFLADEEVGYIQRAKIDYVITQVQMASVDIPANTTVLSAYRLYFINPTKEMFFLIQDSNVVQTNDYYNYFNTSSGSQQLVNLQLQFNGENNIDPTVADALYLGDVQFMNNHTRVPNNGLYNYSFSIDPENYLPTGQVNMSRIMNQNLWINMTENPTARTVRVYTVSYNILRVQNGLGGCLFIDNNTSIFG
jgi:hypothetical protein